MIEEYKDYLVVLDWRIPDYLYEALASLLISGVLVILLIKGLKNGWRMTAGWVLIEYVFLILCSTLIFRPENEVRTHHFRPFWSYEQCFTEGGFHLNPEIGLNILVFIPVGLLLGMCFRNFNWWKVLMIGGGLSILIEVLQLITKRGLSEFDDVFNNTIGCMAGYGLYCLMSMIGKVITTKTQ